MTDVVGFNLSPDENLSLTDLLRMDANNHVEALVVSDTARKEWAIERSLKQMREDWHDMEFTSQPYKESGVNVLAGLPSKKFNFCSTSYYQNTDHGIITLRKTSRWDAASLGRVSSFCRL